MAQAQSKRQSRKRRRASASAGGATPPRDATTGGASRRASTAPRRDPARPRGGTADSLATMLTGQTFGERPPSLFGGVPVSEVAILVGAIGVVVGLASSASKPLFVGIAVCTLGVLEVTAREHFSGYRAHTTLLAGIPAVAVGVVMIAVWQTTLARATLFAVVLPVFGVLFWALRGRFRRARQARVVRPPGA